MRISDWSSDVCSSDLRGLASRHLANGVGDHRLFVFHHQIAGIEHLLALADAGGPAEGLVHEAEATVAIRQRQSKRERSEQRRNGGRGFGGPCSAPIEIGRASRRGKSVSVRVALGCRRGIKKKK